MTRDLVRESHIEEDAAAACGPWAASLPADGAAEATLTPAREHLAKATGKGCIFVINDESPWSIAGTIGLLPRKCLLGDAALGAPPPANMAAGSGYGIVERSPAADFLCVDPTLRTASRLRRARTQIDSLRSTATEMSTSRGTCLPLNGKMNHSFAAAGTVQYPLAARPR